MDKACDEAVCEKAEGECPCDGAPPSDEAQTKNEPEVVGLDEFPELAYEENLPTEMDSLCMNCQEEGVTKFLLVTIPFFKQIIVSAFSCPHCHYSNNEVAPGTVPSLLFSNYTCTHTRVLSPLSLSLSHTHSLSLLRFSTVCLSLLPNHSRRRQPGAWSPWMQATYLTAQ